MSFGCAFGDQKDDHHFVRVKALKMNVFAHQVMPGIPPNQASMLSTLMAAARAKAVGFLRFINDDDENELEIDDDDDDDDDDGEDDDLMLENWFGLAPPPAAAPIINNNNLLVPVRGALTRAKVPRMKQYESTWWTRYLAPEVRDTLIDHPNGRLHGKFRKLSIYRFLSSASIALR